MKTVILFLAVLVLAVSAVSADEGWVLWTHQIWVEMEIDRWTPSGSAESLEECRAAAETGLRKAAQKFTGRARILHAGMTVTMHFPSGGGQAHFIAVCLPARVDPREPK